MKNSMKLTGGFLLVATMGTGWWTLTADPAPSQSPGYTAPIAGASTNLPAGVTDKPLPGMSTNAINPAPPTPPQ